MSCRNLARKTEACIKGRDCVFFSLLSLSPSLEGWEKGNLGLALTGKPQAVNLGQNSRKDRTIPYTQSKQTTVIHGQRQSLEPGSLTTGDGGEQGGGMQHRVKRNDTNLSSPCPHPGPAPHLGLLHHTSQ